MSLGNMFYTREFIENVLNVSELPEYLYHYTSIETLAHILSGRKLRFARLDTVNDPDEARTTDMEQASTLVFVSCWTAEDKELLAMWKIYAPDMQGVRLRFPSNLFLGRKRAQIVEEGGAVMFIDESVDIHRKPPAPNAPIRSLYGPNKVLYTDDINYLIPNCIYEHDGFTQVILHDLGKAKNPYWSFEAEWRFMLYAIPYEIRMAHDSPTREIILDLESYPVIENDYFLGMDRTAIEEMTIRLGPRITLAQRLIVEALRDKYCPSVKIEESALRVR